MNDPNATSDPVINRIGSLVLHVIGPALSVLAVSSVAFFLVEICYSGPLTGRVKWIFALFSFAAVLISRISIEEGFERASFFGLVLGLATLVVLMRLIEGNPLILTAILAFVWWVAGRLTWDCTFVDETRDASGSGMIDLAIERVNRFRERNSQAKRAATDVDDGISPDPDLVQPLETAESHQNSSWQQFVNIFFRRRQANTPGLWAFYFLLAGLPLFGLGQLLMRMTDAAGHRAAAIHFFVYMTAILCLLMLSSVLGLHRYLKKNNSSVPGSVAKRWIVTGTILAALILGTCFLLPRPSAKYSIGHWLPRLTSRNLPPSDISYGRDGQQQSDDNSNVNAGPQSRDNAQNADQSSNGTSGNSKTGNDGSTADRKGGENPGGKAGEGKSGRGSKKKQSSSGTPDKKSGESGRRSDGNQKGNANDSGEKSGKPSNDGQSKDETPDKGSNAEKDGERPRGLDTPKDKRKRANAQQQEKRGGSRSRNSRQRQSSNNPPRESKDRDKKKDPDKKNAENKNKKSASLAMVGKLFRLVMWLAAAIVLIWFLIRYRSRISPWIRSFLDEMAEFWRRLWNRKKKVPVTAEPAKTHSGRSPVLPSFPQFQDPFQSGAARTWTPDRLVKYTFQAFEAWSRDLDCPREPDQTAHEFARQTGEQFGNLADEAQVLAELYSQLAYATVTISRPAAMTLSRLWEKLANMYSPAVA